MSRRELPGVAGKIGAAHGTLRSAESIAHLFIAPPRASTRWFDHLFPTHPALEDRVDVLARMGAGLDQRAVADALEAGHRHHEAAAAEEAARSAKARRRDRPGPAGMDAAAVGPTAESDARAASGIPVYQRPDGWSTVLVRLDTDADVGLSGSQSGGFLEITLPDGRAGWVARTAPLAALQGVRVEAGHVPGQV